MDAFIFLVIVFGSAGAIAAIVSVIRISIKDKRREDAMQRQRERQHDEMWRRVNEAVAEYTKDAPFPERNFPD